MRMIYCILMLLIKICIICKLIKFCNISIILVFIFFINQTKMYDQKCGKFDCLHLFAPHLISQATVMSNKIKKSSSINGEILKECYQLYLDVDLG